MPLDTSTALWPAAVIAMFALAGPALAQQGQGAWQTPGPIQQPKGPWRTPGEIQVPKGPWQVPGEIQVPKGIAAVKSLDTACERRVTVVADALFDFDKAEIRTDAAETLAAMAPEITRAGKHPVIVEGHTDAIGTEAYNMRLSEQRARAVRDWLAGQGTIPENAAIKGFGKTRPVAPNQTADGRDNPEGRQRNRRVEIAIDTCKQESGQKPSSK
jgi:outer membrane protein OmpA-like peptidoglycan-associated protein